MTNRYFEFSDVVSFQPIAVDNKVKRLFEAKDSNSESGYSLLARINATHSGLITGNFGIYFPNHMKDGLKSFTKPFNKPWLLNHDDNGVPVGRIQKADYISLADSYPRLADKIRQLESGSLDREEEVALMKSMMKTLENPKHQGFGFASLVVKITDQETIQRVLDGTYLTVSTRQRSESATCSICLADWLKGDHCSHFPGEFDKEANQRCYIFTGPLFYKEGSFVPVPADEFAQVAEIYEDGVLKDRLEIRPERRIHVPVDVFLQGSDKLINVRNNFDLTAHAEILDQLASLVHEMEEPEIEDSKDSNTNQDQGNQGGKPVMILKELMSDHDLLIQEVIKLVPNSKDSLSYKNMAKLSDSDFHGPQRTFPKISQEVTDAYLTVLASCEDQEAKDFLAKLKSETSVDTLSTALDTLTGENLHNLINKVITKAQADSDLMSKTIWNLSAFKTLQVEVDSFKNQVSTLETDLQNAVSNVATLTTELKDTLSELLLVHSTVEAEVNDKKEFLDTLKDETVSTLKDKIKTFVDEFNPQSLRDKINSAHVEDPSLKEEAKKQKQVEVNKEVSNTYFRLLDKDEAQASQYLMTQYRIGKIPSDFKPSKN